MRTYTPADLLKLFGSAEGAARAMDVSVRTVYYWLEWDRIPDQAQWRINRHLAESPVDKRVTAGAR